MPDDTHSHQPVIASVAAATIAPISLADLPLRTPAFVVGVRAAGDSSEARELALRLLEIGFMEGEPVRVIAQGHPGREPIAVRIGGTTFALRRFEAEQVLVATDAVVVAEV
jgi:ferrous iron transport protein A